MSGVLFSLLAAIGIVASLCMVLALVRREWMRQHRIVAACWMIVLGCLAGVMVLNSGWVRPRPLFAPLIEFHHWSISWLEASVVVVGLGIGSFLLWQIWSQPVARWCVLIALLIGLTNPLTEAIELHLVTDGSNYQFVSNDQPYRFRTGPQTQLDRIQTIQEVSESLSVFMLALGLALVVLHPAPDEPVGMSAGVSTLAAGDRGHRL